MKRPPLACCAKSASKAAFDVIKGKVLKKKPILISIIERDARLEICKGCEEYDDGVCLNCGCILKVKAFLTTMSCPLDKW